MPRHNPASRQRYFTLLAVGLLVGVSVLALSRDLRAYDSFQASALKKPAASAGEQTTPLQTTQPESKNESAAAAERAAALDNTGSQDRSGPQDLRGVRDKSAAAQTATSKRRSCDNCKDAAGNFYLYVPVRPRGEGAASPHSAQQQSKQAPLSEAELVDRLHSDYILTPEGDVLSLAQWVLGGINKNGGPTMSPSEQDQFLGNVSRYLLGQQAVHGLEAPLAAPFAAVPRPVVQEKGIKRDLVNAVRLVSGIMGLNLGADETLPHLKPKGPKLPPSVVRYRDGAFPGQSDPNIAKFGRDLRDYSLPEKPE